MHWMHWLRQCIECIGCAEERTSHARKGNYQLVYNSKGSLEFAFSEELAMKTVYAASSLVNDVRRTHVGVETVSD